MAMPSLNPGTMTFGELFVMLLNPVRVHLLLHLVLIITPRACARGKIIGCVVVVVVVVSTKIAISRDVGI